MDFSTHHISLQNRGASQPRTWTYLFCQHLKCPWHVVHWASVDLEEAVHSTSPSGPSMRCCRCWTLQRLPTIRLAHSRMSLGLCCPTLGASFWPLPASIAKRRRANGLGPSVPWLEWFEVALSILLKSAPLCWEKITLYCQQLLLLYAPAP